MSHHHGCKWVEELFMQVVEENEPLKDSPWGIQRIPTNCLLTPNRPLRCSLWNTRSPIGAAGAAGTSTPSLCPSRVARASGTATPGLDSPQGIISGSELGQNLGGAPNKSDSSEVSKLHKEYADFINLKDNAEIVLTEAMEATEQLNTVFNQIGTSMNRMSLMMKKILIVLKLKSSGKTIEPGNNWACDKAAAKAATK
ncbi:hypothetical protein M422DRAFT_248418 [Sphaerobolus stellatus SS14]|uniref:Uncharacterized protein n=1 Tax=Sphaerobolus stellatus (strain SS14) TaxID=990650 RepID=A0A0C9VVU7_SPHS4|nr:hypothetical protein M422DRAFT_248418 [Sphaerobolus stellatus SS14]